MFGLFDFSFVYWILFGAVTVVIGLGAHAWLQDRQIPMPWWKWIILGLWYVAALGGIAAPFTIMGEDELGAGLRLLAVNLPVVVITGFVVWRILEIGRAKRSA